MFRVLKYFGKYRDWKIVSVAGVLGFAIALAVMEIIDTYSMPLTALSIARAAVTGSLFGMCLVGSLLALRVRRKLSEQNMRLDGAINNMIQGLCMFDAQNRLMVWNERYRAMYRIDPSKIWVGCTIRDLLNARIAAGTFPLDPGSYDADLRAALKQGKTFTLNIELADGRVIAVVNQPMAAGGWVATHEDMTERTRAERDLERTRAFLDTIIENVPSPIIVKDIPGLRYILINRAAEKYLGVDRAAMLGKTAVEVMPKVSARWIEAEDQKLIASGQIVFNDEHAVVTPGNGTRIVTATRLSVIGSDGKPQYLISLIRDITERKRDEQRIAHMAHHDPLTDLPNRAAFNECIAATLELAAVTGDSFAVLCIDLDRFKAVNDVFGHAVGDALLREVARRLETACQGAFLARIGGDEFTVITPTAPQPAAAEALAERLTAAFDSDIDIDGHPLRVELTIGVGIYPQDGADATTLVANADAALFRAKSEARGSIRFFEMSMDKQLREKRRCSRTCAARSCAMSSRSITSRKRISTERLPDLRRSCAGTIRVTGWCRPQPSSRSPRRAASSWRSANGFCGAHVAKRRHGRGRCTSPSICRRCNSSTATCRAWCIRFCWRPVCRRRGWNWRSPKAC